MKKIYFSIVVCLLLTSGLFAQDFNSAIGLRLGYPTSVTYKKFISSNNAIEVFAGYRNFVGASFFTVSGAYQIHKDFDSVDRLQWYYGAGASAFLWSVDFGDGSTSLGIQGYLGLSYTLSSAPVNFSIDWIPTVFINGLEGYGRGFGSGYGSLAVRYVLGGGDS